MNLLKTFPNVDLLGLATGCTPHTSAGLLELAGGSIYRLAHGYDELAFFEGAAVRQEYAQPLRRLQAARELFARSLAEQMQQGIRLDAPAAVREFLIHQLAGLPYEVFMVLFLDAQNCLISARDLFRGTLTQTSVYPREVIKLALTLNAASVIFAHNHPSGVPEPSRADEALTSNLRQGLAFVDVKVLDHFIVAGNNALSFAERGLL